MKNKALPDILWSIKGLSEALRRGKKDLFFLTSSFCTIRRWEYRCLGIQLVYLLEDYTSALGKRFLLQKLSKLFIGNEHGTYTH